MNITQVIIYTNTYILITYGVVVTILKYYLLIKVEKTSQLQLVRNTYNTL